MEDIRDNFRRLYGKTFWPKPPIGEDQGTTHDDSQEISRDGTQDLAKYLYTIPGLNPDDLLQFFLTAVAVAKMTPEVRGALGGIDITTAIFEALPGFLAGISGKWLPTGL